MKARYALVALLTLAFFGCDDNTGSLGLGMFPNDDQAINGRLSTFDITTESVSAGRIYAKTNIGYIGKFTDPTFGTYKAGFLTELNCPQNITFPAVYQELDKDGNKVEEGKGVKATGKMLDEGTMIGEQKFGNIHAVEINLWYSTYFGDSLTACRLSIYELNKRIEKSKAYYTDINPEEFYNAQTGLLGRKAYTAVDKTIADSIKKQNGYVPKVNLILKDKSLGRRILTAARTGNLSDQFNNEIMKGLYIKSDYGDGTILYINQVQLNVVCECYVTDAKTGLKLKKKYEKDKEGNQVDSTYYAYLPFSSTREMIQANQLTNDENKINELIQVPTWTYLKTPAGIFTEMTLPLSKIEAQLKGDTLNAAKLAIPNYHQESDKKFGMTAPTTMLLVREKDKEHFFEKNLLNNNITSFLTSHTKATNQYSFDNIVRLIITVLAEKDAAEKEIAKAGTMKVTVRGTDGEDKEVTVTSLNEWKTVTKWDKVCLIPVHADVTTAQDYYGQQTSKVVSIQHNLAPSYVRLKGGKAGLTDDAYKLKLEVVSTNFGQNQTLQSLINKNRVYLKK
ncbi:MAG: DUF4270 domain-containing protein [Bacteroidia bacterium]|nr:DUF4270 domain-containing protein [Bacteroidia bacterium]